MRILTDAAQLDVAGGIEWNTLQLARALGERGHQVTALYGRDGALRERYKRAGITLVGPVDFAYESRTPLRSLVRFSRAGALARRHAPDVFWLNRVEHVQWATVVAARTRTRVVCQLHHMPRAEGESRLLGRVAHYVAVSRFVRDAWVGAGVSDEAISVNYNAVAREDYPFGGLDERREARERLGLSSERPTVLYYGRISEDKGIGVLFDAWADVARASGARLLLVGAPSPWDVPTLATRLASLDPVAVRYVGAIEDVVSYLHASDVVVVPSLAPEAFGRVALEALASGRPVVATRSGALGEILSGPMSRFLVEVGDAAELARRLTSLLEWRTREPALGETCHAWAEATFPFEEMVSSFESVLARFARAT
jgi:glycosyltransferase involved in cell wall biosynthesis